MVGEEMVAMNEPVEFCEGIWWFYEAGRWTLRAVAVLALVSLTACGEQPRFTAAASSAEVPHLCEGGKCK